nr:MAG TPA_asm: hypothetical protein [Caudoviricetes sp.]
MERTLLPYHLCCYITSLFANHSSSTCSLLLVTYFVPFHEYVASVHSIVLIRELRTDFFNGLPCLSLIPPFDNPSIKPFFWSVVLLLLRSGYCLYFQPYLNNRL